MSLLLLPILAHAFSVTVGDTSEARLRFDGIGQHLDLTSEGRFALQLDLRRTNWTLYYAPSILQINVGEANSTYLLLHHGGLAGNLRLSQRTSASWFETATYGQMNLRAQAVGAQQQNAAAGSGPGAANPAPGQAGTGVLIAPGSTTITYGALSSGIGINHKLERNWSTKAFAGYTITGELDSTVPVTIPRSRTLSASWILANEFSRLNESTLTLSGRHTFTEPRAEVYIAILGFGWTHRLSRWATMSSFAGAAYLDSADSLGSHSKGFVPVASETLTLNSEIHSAGYRLTATTAVGLAPVVDYFTGATNEMLTTELGFNLAQRRLSFQLFEYGSTSVASYGNTTLVSAYGLVESFIYQLDRRQHWSVTGGSRQAWQKYSIGNQDQPILWTVFLAATYTSGAIPL